MYIPFKKQLKIADSVLHSEFTECQKRESIGSEVSIISNEPVPGEAVSTPTRGRGRGKGKGRGKKAQPKRVMDCESEAFASTSPQIVSSL